MITKPSNIGRWLGAIIAAIVLVAVSFVGFRAFNGLFIIGGVVGV